MGAKTLNRVHQLIGLEEHQAKDAKQLPRGETKISNVCKLWLFKYQSNCQE